MATTEPTAMTHQILFSSDLDDPLAWAAAVARLLARALPA